MKIGVVTTSFPLHPDSTSGAFVQHLASQLADSADVVVLTPAATSATLPASPQYALRSLRYAPRTLQRLAHQPGGIPVALARQPWLWALVPCFLLALFWASYRLARKVDVVHANWSINGAVAGLAARLAGKPVITTLRGSDVDRATRKLLDRLLLRWSARLSSTLTCVSHGLEREAALLLPPGSARLEVVPNGVAEAFFSIPLPAPRRPLRLLFVGSLIPRKSLDTLLQALALVGDPGAMTLRIVGDGPERERMVALARHLELQIDFAGAQPPAAIPDELAAHDVLVLPSLYEGRPNVVLEAMAAARAVVASALPGTGELIEHDRTGLLFPAGDSRRLAECLQRLAAHHALVRQFGMAARDHLAASGLTWDSTAARYIALYQQATRASD